MAEKQLAYIWYEEITSLSPYLLGVSQTLRRWTEGATYIRQGGHHISSSFFFYLFSSPILSRRRLDVYHTSTHGVALVRISDAVWNVLHAARWKYRTQKLAKNSPSGHHRTICRAISSQLRYISTIEKNLLNSNISSTCLHNMVNFGPLTAEIGSLVWGTPANFNGFRVLAALLHGTLVGVSQNVRHWIEGYT